MKINWKLISDMDRGFEMVKEIIVWVKHVLTLCQCLDVCLSNCRRQWNHDKFSLIDWLPPRRIIHQNSSDDSHRAIRQFPAREVFSALSSFSSSPSSSPFYSTASSSSGFLEYWVMKRRFKTSNHSNEQAL